MVAPSVLDVRLPATTSSEVARECACLAARLRVAAVATVVCHAESLPGQLPAVEALARLSLVARRGGATFTVRGMNAELAWLIQLLGLDDLLQPYDEAAPGDGIES